MHGDQKRKPWRPEKKPGYSVRSLEIRKKSWRPEKKIVCLERSLETRNEAMETGRKKALVS